MGGRSCAGGRRGGVGAVAVSPAWVADALDPLSGESRPLIWRRPQSATFSALPWPNLQIVDARLDDAAGVNVVSAPEARVDLSLVDLAARQGRAGAGDARPADDRDRP